MKVGHPHRRGGLADVEQQYRQPHPCAAGPERVGRAGVAVAKLPRVSVLVPARNEEANIERCVAALLAQDYPDFEVLVLDDESTDGTGCILALSLIHI